jgi:hypothetical protein
LENADIIIRINEETDTICSAPWTPYGELNTFLGFSAIEAFICSECGEGVKVARSVQ